MRHELERTQGSEDADEHVEAAAVAFGETLRRAITRGDVPIALRLLETEVVALDGRSLTQSSQVGLDELAIASSAGGYRAGAPVLALRALGDAYVAELLVQLLDAADGADARGPIAELLREHRALHAAVRHLALERGPSVAQLVESVLPGSIALRPGEIDQILGLLRAAEEPDTDWMNDTIRRVACGVLAARGSRRKALEPLFFAIAETEHPHAPAALEALVAAGVALERERGGITAMEHALIAGARDNAEKLRALGSPRPREEVLQAAAHASSVGTFAARRKARRAALGPDPDAAEARAKARAIIVWKTTLSSLIVVPTILGSAHLLENGHPIGAAIVLLMAGAGLYRVLSEG